MTKKEWENRNTCWTCKHRKILAGRIHCGHTIHDGTYKALWNVDIINSPYCPHREKEDWRGKMRGDISHRGRKGNFLPGEKEESWKTAIREKEQKNYIT